MPSAANTSSRGRGRSSYGQRKDQSNVELIPKRHPGRRCEDVRTRRVTQKGHQSQHSGHRHIPAQPFQTLCIHQIHLVVSPSGTRSTILTRSTPHRLPPSPTTVRI